MPTSDGFFAEIGALEAACEFLSCMNHVAVSPCAWNCRPIRQVPVLHIDAGSGFIADVRIWLQIYIIN